ncbi:MAG: suppressor of fused domain protein [Pirellulales bacterium]
MKPTLRPPEDRNKDLSDATYRRFNEALFANDTPRVLALLDEHPEAIRLYWYIGRTLLHFAASLDNVELMKTLIDRGIDVNTEGVDEAGPLMSAMSKSALNAAEYLLDHGVDPNQDRTLIQAINADEHSLEFVKLLVEHGADIHREYTFGPPPVPLENALSWAIARGKHDVADYLRSQGAVMPNQTGTKAGKGASPEMETVAYFQKQFGSVQPLALREIVPDDPSISIHAISPTTKRRSLILFTTGLSQRPMNTPPDGQEFRFAELFIELPADWPLDENSLSDPRFGWPIHWLRSTAKYPVQHDTWLGGPLTIIANEEPPQPLAPGLEFTSLLLLAEKRFTTSDGRDIRIYRMTPLYTEERELEISQGAAALMNAFDKKGIAFKFDPKRPNVAIASRSLKRN